MPVAEGNVWGIYSNGVGFLADQSLWQQRLEASVNRKLCTRAFAAFNTNIDAVVHLNGPQLEQILKAAEDDLWQSAPWKGAKLPSSVRTKADFATVLYTQLQAGKSCHIVVEGPVLDWINSCFPQATESMGGQAGIIANQMAALGAEADVYTPLLSTRQARLFHPAVQAPVIADDGSVSLLPVMAAANPNAAVKVNWIFEYAKGETFTFGDEKVVTPRANRVIMATRPKESVMAFAPEYQEHLVAMGERWQVAFMAGYHYVTQTGTGDFDFASYMDYTCQTLHKLTMRNPRLRLHYEYVPMKSKQLEAPVLRGISSHIHSLGINENEIRRALYLLGQESLAETIEAAEHAYSLYLGARSLLRTLGLQRLHVHNLGYYVVVLRRPYPLNLDDVVSASLYASAVNAMKAQHGGYPTSEQAQEAGTYPLSEIGFAQLDRFTAKIGKENMVAEGLWEFDDHYVLVIPAHVVSRPLSTVGMGDTISSASFAMEASLLAVDNSMVKC